MKLLVAAALMACLAAGCAENYDGRYPIDTIRTRTEGRGRAEAASETFPLNAWFEIRSGEFIKVHDGGVTSVYRNPGMLATRDGFEAVSPDPRGAGKCSLSFERTTDGLCSLTLTYDRVHYLVLLSKGLEDR